MAAKVRSLEMLTKDCLYYCLNLKKENDLREYPLIEHKPIDNFWNKIINDHRFYKIFSFELTERFLGDYIMQFKKHRVDDVDVDYFLGELKKHLKLNMQDYWVIFPLKGALLPESILSENYFLLGGKKEEILENLKRYLSQDFYENTIRQLYKSDNNEVLMGYKIKCQSEYIHHYYNRLGYYLNSLMHVYYYARVHPNNIYNSSRLEFFIRDKYQLFVDESKINRKAIIFADRNSILGVIGYDCECKLDLSFFNKEEHLNAYLNVVNFLLNDDLSLSKLKSKFLNTLKIFKSAISLEDRDRFTGISISIVLLTTTCEALLLKHNDKKRDNLKSIISSIYNGSEYTKAQIKEIVDKIYTLRSEFVHGGKHTFKDFNKDFTEGDSSKTFKDFKIVLSCVLFYLITYIESLEEQKQNTEYFDQYIAQYKI